MTGDLRTCTVLEYADGKGHARYVVLRGPMKGAAFNSGTAEVLARYEIEHPALPDYYGWTQAHATADAPPVPWLANPPPKNLADL